MKKILKCALESARKMSEDLSKETENRGNGKGCEIWKTAIDRYQWRRCMNASKNVYLDVTFTYRSCIGAIASQNISSQ